ncbi:MAG TPA: gamma-glutamyltransferase [Steroidobacteraceae bacterium]|nr:gamma-glutamyltransferase [Steroidobacteraceae bacterium]
MKDHDANRSSLRRICCLFALLLLSQWALADEARKPPVAAIASAYPLASEAGFEILAAGGNAFDAAVAVSAALEVTEPRGSGLGGGGFYLLHRASDGLDLLIDAREVAPAAATRDMFLDAEGKVIPGRSTDTALAAAIPGEVAAWARVAEKFGRLPLKQSLQPAIRLARKGFPMYERMAQDIGRKRPAFERSPDGKRIFLLNGAAPTSGQLFKQPELARSLSVVADQGADGFYKGPFAEKLVAGVRKLGGIWSLDDLANYRLIERQPLVGEYRGVRIVTAPPPSSGGVAVLNALNILDGYDLAQLDSATRKHVIIESLRRVHRDRAEYLGDPAFVSMPIQRLLSPDYAAGERASIRLDRATPSDALPGYVGDTSSGVSTTHFAILDREGNRVAVTITLNAWFGTGLVIPGTGILLNNEMDDFAIKPGQPNIYKLVGAEANSVAPGKRPLSSMTPTFLESEKGIAILGSPGGSFIPSMVLLGTLNWLNGADAMGIVIAPRIHHQYEPDVVFAEPKGLTAEERQTLEQRGHKFRDWPPTIGNMQVITWDYATGAVVAASDPRGVGQGMTR